MRRLGYFIISSLLLLLVGCTAQREKVEPMTFENSHIEQMISKSLGEYKITTYWPSGPAPKNGWPILYILDGNSFSPIAATILNNQSCPRCSLNNGVIVAIDYFGSSRRAKDYTPSPDSFHLEILPNGQVNIPPAYGGAATFRLFIEQELMPRINKRFPINQQQQTLFGHSLGGLFVLDTYLMQPNLFNHYVAASPSLWFSHQYLLDKTTQIISQQKECHGNRPITLFVTVGELEQSLTPDELLLSKEKRDVLLTHRSNRKMLDNSNQFIELNREKQCGNIQLQYKVYPNQTHQTAPIFTLQDALSDLFKK